MLRAVSSEDSYANLLLPARLRSAGLTGRDAAFTTELVAGTLRRQGTYDEVLGACLTKPRSTLQPAVLDVLRMGAHQLLGMRVSAHAAVATSVDLVRDSVGRGPAGLVNAVLRRVGEHDLAGWVRLLAPDPVSDPHGFLALAQAHPRWVVDELAAALGPRADELDALLRSDNEPPHVTLAARPGLCDRSELLTAAGAQTTAYSPWGVVLTSGDPGGLAAVTQGRAGVQDEGSQLVALALIRAAPAPAGQAGGERWLDACAGPGGKAALLGATAAQRGGSVLAADVQPHRAELVRRSGATLPPGAVSVVATDSTTPPWRPGTFDRVLVDAPCTGLGALRRRPEARWRRRPDDLETLVPRQQGLLGSALNAVRAGGIVVYATCSPVLAETQGVVTATLEGRTDVELIDAGALLPEVADLAGPLAGTVQLWPHRHGTDAMFLAVLART